MLRKILFFNVFFFCILHHFKHLRTIYLLTYFMEFDFEDGLIAEDEVLKRQMEDQGIVSSSIARSSGKHSVVCRHYVLGNCMKGDLCDFLHQFDLTRMPECHKYMKFGRCDEVGCQFKHTKSDEKIVCMDYRWGFCSLGPTCRKRHENLQSVPELVPDWYLQTILDNSNHFPKLDSELDRKLQQIIGHDSTNISSLQGIVPGLPIKPTGSLKVFIVKSITMANIELSVHSGYWASSPVNNAKFSDAFESFDHVILIFSANESGGFQGYARMSSLPSRSFVPGIWGRSGTRLGASFKVQWLKQCAVSFEEFSALRNPLNENAPVKKSKDGCELPPDLAGQICRVLWESPDVDILAASNLPKRSAIDHTKMPLGSGATLISGSGGGGMVSNNTGNSIIGTNYNGVSFSSSSSSVRDGREQAYLNRLNLHLNGAPMNVHVPALNSGNVNTTRGNQTGVAAYSHDLAGGIKSQFYGSTYNNINNTGIRMNISDVPSNGSINQIHQQGLTTTSGQNKNFDW